MRGCTGPLVPVWHYDLNILSNMSFGVSHIHNPNVTVHNGFYDLEYEWKEKGVNT